MPLNILGVMTRVNTEYQRNIDIAIVVLQALSIVGNSFIIFLFYRLVDSQTVDGR